MTNFILSTILDVAPVMWVHVGLILLIPIILVVGVIVYVGILLSKRAKKKQQERENSGSEETGK